MYITDAGLYLSRLEAKMVGDSEGRSASTLMRVGMFPIEVIFRNMQRLFPQEVSSV